MIDVDAALWIEYHNGSKEPVVLIETARDVGQNIKPVTVLKALARRLHPIVPAYLLLYTPSARLNPAADGVPDIEWFRYKRIWPDPEIGWLFAKPQDWAYHLLCLRQQYSISGNTRRLGAA